MHFNLSAALTTLVITLTLGTPALADTNATTLDKIKNVTQKSWHAALNMTKVSTLGLANLTYHHPVKAALAVMAGLGAFSVAKSVLICKSFERKYLKRYEAMKESYYESGTDSKRYCINDDGSHEYYTHFDEAAHVMEEAFTRALHRKDAHKLALRTERLGLRAALQQTQVGNQDPLYLVHLFTEIRALRSVLLDLTMLVMQGQIPYQPLADEDKAAQRYEALETVIMTLVDASDSVEDIAEQREAFLIRIRQDNQTFREQGIQGGIIDMESAADIFASLLRAKEQTI